MPRKSPHDIPPVYEIRPDPPAGMSEDAAAIWRACVACMCPGWVGGEAYALLARYCFAMADSAKLETELLATPLSDRGRAVIVRQYKDMCGTALAYGRALRLSPRGNTPRDVRDNGHGQGRDLTVRQRVMPYDL